MGVPAHSADLSELKYVHLLSYYISPERKISFGPTKCVQLMLVTELLVAKLLMTWELLLAPSFKAAPKKESYRDSSWVG